MARATKIVHWDGGNPPSSFTIADDGGGKTEYLLAWPTTSTDADVEIQGAGFVGLVLGADGAPRLGQSVLGLPREMVLKCVSLGAAGGVGAASNWAPGTPPSAWFRYESK